MKSAPLLNGRTANPSEASKRPVALSIMGSSSTKQTISEEGFSLDVIRICAPALFSMWDVAIMPHIRSRPVSRILDLSLMDFSLMRAGGPTRRQRAPRRAPDQALLHDARCFLVSKAPELQFGNQIFMLPKRARAARQ